MIRGFAVLGTILVALALTVDLLGAESDELTLTPTTVINVMKSMPIAPGPPSSWNGSDQAIEEGTAPHIIGGLQRVWGDGVRSPRLE